jgi:thiol-disulfide isomerase/thioredoxin
MKLHKLIANTIPALAAGLLFFSSCNNAGKKSSAFELTGNLSQAGEGIKVYLDRLLPDTVQHLDSTTIGKDGSFSFHTSGIYKGFYTLRITEQNYVTLILDSAENVKVTGNAQNLGYTYTVDGSPDSKLFWQFNMKSKMNMMARDSMQHLFEAIVNTLGKNPKRVDSLNEVFEKPYDALMAEQDSFLKNFVTTNINSFACLAAIQQLSPDKDIAYYNLLDSALTKEYPNSVYVTLFHNKNQSMQKVAIGSMAPDITLPDTSGNMVSLAGLKGKYVLVDFWASWCGPCKESLPGLVKIYDEYKDKNFTVFSVSLDKFKPEWEAAIKHFGLTWTQVSELKYWDSKVVKLYNFDGIPFTVLISPEGRIIDKKVSDADLEAELHSLLDKPKA